MRRQTWAVVSCFHCLWTQRYRVRDTGGIVWSVIETSLSFSHSTHRVDAQQQSTLFLLWPYIFYPTEVLIWTAVRGDSSDTNLPSTYCRLTNFYSDWLRPQFTGFTIGRSSVKLMMWGLRHFVHLLIFQEESWLWEQWHHNRGQSKGRELSAVFYIYVLNV